MRRVLRRLRTEDIGEFIVTPTIAILLGVSTLVFGTFAYFGARSVAPKVESSRQGLQIDENGEVVHGAVGVVPVPNAKPKKTPEPKPEAPPRVITRERIIERDPEPQTPSEPAPDPGPVVIYNPGDDGHTSSGDEHTSNSGDPSGHDDGNSNCCSGGHDDPHHDP